MTGAPNYKAELVGVFGHPVAENPTPRDPRGTDLLVNATSIGLFPNVGDRPEIAYESVGPGVVACDVIHTPTTPFLDEARRRGAQTVDGLGILVYQGAIGLKLWTGLDAPVKVMYDALAKAFGLA